MRALLLMMLLASGCRRSSEPASAAVPALALSDPAKQPALRDLVQDLATARAAIAAGKSPVYACERLAVAARELAGERDEGVMKLLADAETVYGHEGPMAWAETKIKEAETSSVDVKTSDCATVKEMLNRVSAKFKDEGRVLELVKRYKSLCPRARSGGGGGSSRGGGSSSSSSSAAAERAQQQQRSDCRNRCDRAAWDCSSRCQCGGCSTTWEQCNNICNTCRQGCDQNERFCKAACGD
ncbi:MAG TPA: hypothetical protein VFF06_32335 [Polyangia bacterium]|nr:hypothetical protein [Polyangia bacterium]